MIDVRRCVSRFPVYGRRRSRTIAVGTLLAGLVLSGCGNAEPPSPPAPQAAAVPAASPVAAEAGQTGAEPAGSSGGLAVEGVAALKQAKIFQPWSGDLEGMVQRRAIRALVVYNRTNYFVDRGQPRGTAYDALKEFEAGLNAKRKLGKLGVNVVFLPVSRDRILAELAAGKGDVALGALTVTPERLNLVDFTTPVFRDSSEIVVTGPGAPAIATLADLSGQEVFVREGGSKHESLVALNERFRREGKPEVVLRFAPGELEDEDLLEMANAGLVNILIVDRLVAEFWRQVFTDITLHPDVAVRSGADVAWAIRKGTPELKAELDGFIATHGKGTAFGNQLLQKYLKSVKYVKGAGSPAEIKKYDTLKELFQRYGDKYTVDWLLMAAQGYQESRLDQSVKSQVGAIGVMQLMPETGKEMQVGDVREVEANIHAGVKYMRFMMDRYYKDEPMKPIDKALFTFASYNAGPGRMRGLRKVAAERGLDPNVWFNNVERIAAEKIGQETVTYVGNIYKYYIGYKLLAAQKEEREKAKQTVAGTAKPAGEKPPR